MKTLKDRRSYLVLMLIVNVLLITGCGKYGGGGRWDEPDTTRPTVTLTNPLNDATGVPVSNKITATFSEDMAPLTITEATFTVVNTTLGGIAVPGDVTYAAGARTATFAPISDLAGNNTFTATIKASVEDLAGNTLAEDYVWSFTTGAAPDTTKPTVTLTVPATTRPGPTLNVLKNTKITATFSEDMDPLTITAATFTVVNTSLGGIAVPGDVTYAVVGRTATFTPTSDLLPGDDYRATIHSAATDLAIIPNHLAGDPTLLPAASDYVWTFRTAVDLDITPPTVTLTNPVDLETGVALNSTVNATFSEPMDPLTISTATFTVQRTGPPLGQELAGTVAYNALTRIATFTPLSPLTASANYTATITTGATDLAVPGNALAPGLVSNPWTFTTGTGLAPNAVPLNSAAGFGIMATSTITNTGLSIVNGDVSLDPGTAITGFPPGLVNGTVHINDSVSAQARTDLLTAYNFAKALASDATVPDGQDLGAWAPPGSTLPAGTLPPGVYTNGSTMSVNTPLTLDAGGNADAVWVFQIGSSLTTFTGAPGGNILLINGAQAKNVFWVPTASATIGVDTIFYGTVLAGVSITGQTRAVINGRLLAGAIGAGTIALDTNIVNVPAR